MSEKKTFQIEGGDISDGYHTFGQFYHHRTMLYLALCRAHSDQCCFKHESADWVILFWESPAGQISYHVDTRYLGFIKGKIKEDDNYEWDRHSPHEAFREKYPRHFAKVKEHVKRL